MFVVHTTENILLSLKLELVVSKKVKYFLQCQVEVDGKNAFARAPHAQTDGQPGNIVSPVPFIAWAIGLPPVPDFPGCPGFVPCCPVSRLDKPRGRQISRISR